ncbi:MAG TPA: porin [Geothrix sp.]|nr:porin [Geothrix sp.]
MKKSTLTTLALCAGAPLFAQTPSVSVYGILDAGVANVSNTLDFDSYHPVGVNPNPVKAVHSATGMFNGGISQTRIGIKASTDLVNGWKAIATLESAINIPSGQVSNAALGIAQSKPVGTTAANYMTADSSISGQLFNRGAFFGVSHPVYGTITMGRQMSLMLEAIPGYDALQGAQLFTPIGFSGGYGGGGATDNSRIDSAIKYRVKVGDFSIGALHKVSGAAGSPSARAAEQINVAYESGPFGVLVAYQSYNDAFVTGAGAAAGQLALTAQDTKSTWVAARYKVGPVLITGGYQSLQFSNPSNPADDLGTTSWYGQVVSSVAVTPYTIAGVEQDKKQNLWWLGACWDVTSDFSAAVSYYSLKQDDFSQGTYNPATLSNAKGPGTTKFISALLDYKITKAFDAYLGFMNAKNADALASGMVAGSPGYVNGYSDSNTTIGLGIRYKF